MVCLRSILSPIGINRNIVECKDKDSVALASLVVGINRNIVECKVIRSIPSPSWVRRINRNIVECKGDYCREGLAAKPVLIETLWNVKIQVSDVTTNWIEY